MTGQLYEQTTVNNSCKVASKCESHSSRNLWSVSTTIQHMLTNKVGGSPPPAGSPHCFNSSSNALSEPFHAGRQTHLQLLAT